MNHSRTTFLYSFHVLAIASWLFAGTFFQAHAASVTRGPYLQMGTSSNLVVRWRTDVATDSRVLWGGNSGNLNSSATDGTLTTEHEIMVSGLSPYSKYFYAIGSTSQVLAGDNTYFFFTSPLPGTAQPVRIWAIGDAGTGFLQQRNVRDTYATFTGNRYTDLWVMLGDNAYCCGTDTQYQSYVFNVYNTLLRQSVLWPTVGNHDTDQNAGTGLNFPYFNIFTLPQNGEAGGVSSGTERYYSFDYANIHFVCLDSMATTFRQSNSAMFQWLHADLSATTRDWIIAFFHHPPYTAGSHNSDTEGDLVAIRQTFLPILESFGVDLVLAGHSHVFERSKLIGGHYGNRNTWNSAVHALDGGSGRTNGTGAYVKPAGGLGANRGTVYIVDGSSGGQGTSGNLDHPAMYYSTYSVGSLILDIHGQRLDGRFLTDSGSVDDYFTIDKSNATNVVPRLNIARVGGNAVISWPTSVPDYRLEHKGVLNTQLTWTLTGILPATNGRKKVVTLPATTGTNQFFQLRRVP